MEFIGPWKPRIPAGYSYPNSRHWMVFLQREDGLEWKWRGLHLETPEFFRFLDAMTRHIAGGQTGLAIAMGPGNGSYFVPSLRLDVLGVTVEQARERAISWVGGYFPATGFVFEDWEPDVG